MEERFEVVVLIHFRPQKLPKEGGNGVERLTGAAACCWGEGDRQILEEGVLEDGKVVREVRTVQQQMITGFWAWHMCSTAKTIAASPMIQWVIGGKETKAGATKSDSGAYQIRVTIKDMIETRDR